MADNVLETKACLLEHGTSEIMERLRNCVASARSERDLAAAVKTELERAEKGEWNAVVGRDFGACVFHKSKSFAHFRIGSLEIIVWKS